MEYMGSIKGEFDISTDCKLGGEYDVSVDECNVEPNYISEY